MNKRLIARLCVACLIVGQVFSTVQAKENVMYQQQVEQVNWQKAGGKVQDALPQVKEPALKDDFSNVINFNQYTGFTKKQLEMLRKNGFVVMPQGSYPYLKMYQNYEELEYSRQPMFITTDAVLNLYHIFYDDSLKLLEGSQLLSAMKSFSSMMLKDSLTAFEDSKDATERVQFKKIVSYYTVAALLSGNNVAVPKEIKDIADKEVALINKASGYEISPLLGKKVDYSQFTVRGHYVSTDKLGKYFKTMMWYGQMGFVVMDDKGQINLDNAKIAMRMSLLASKNEKAYELWDKVYTATSTYVGAADDLGPNQIGEMIGKVYGENVTQKSFSSTKKDVALIEAIKALPAPQIVAKMQFTEDTVQEKQFRMMGQRYTIDADVMQQLMKPKDRPENSGLDVMAALGSTRAQELAEKYENPNNWAEYSTKLNEVQESVKGISETTWKSNMYNGWLWTLQSQLKSFEGVKGMPNFMQTEAWTDKSIVGALGSYAELKHDTVLYYKQACAERGGPEEMMPYIYVEPNVEVYTKLLSLLTTTKQNLAKIGTLNQETKQMLDQMTKYITTMKSCANKELSNQQFTEDEYYTLKAFGGMVDSISRQLLDQNRKYDSGISETYTSALISDVTTIADTQEYLELGTGIPYDIFVICPYAGKLFLAKGTTFSYYEFTSNERLTDEKWHKMLGIQKETVEGGDFEYISTDSNASGYKGYAPQWINSFVSGEVGHVKNEQVEVKWEGAYK